MSDLKKAWKQTAKSLVIAANDLAEAVVDSAKVGREKVVNWAQSDNDHVPAEGQEIASEEIPSEESPAESTEE